MNKLSATILVVVTVVVVFPVLIQAGFGVSPPFVKQEHLLRGSHFEETVNLVRSEPKEEYRAELEFSSELSEIKDWITIDKGMEFTIGAGIQQFPLKIIVDVPQDAKLGEYGGYVWISGKPEKEGQVTTIAGGTIKVVLKVTDKEFSAWRLRDLGVRDLAKGEKTLKVYLKVENLGNVKTRPSKVHLDVYDNHHQNLLTSGDDTDLDWIPPFQTKEIAAEFPVDLEPIQQYWAEIEVYKDGEVFLADKRRFNVGEIPTVGETPKTEASPSEEGLESDFSLDFLKSKTFWFVLLAVAIATGIGLGIRKARKYEPELKDKNITKRRKKF